MATELEGIKEVTEAILGIGEVAIDNFTFKVFNQPVVSCIKNIDSFFLLEAFLQMVSVLVHHRKCPGPGKQVLW